MSIKLLSPFSLARRDELIDIAKEKYNLKLDSDDPLVDLMSYMDYLISCKIAYLGVALFIFLLGTSAGILFLLLNFFLRLITK